MYAVVAVPKPTLMQEAHIGDVALGYDGDREDKRVRQIGPKGVQRTGRGIRFRRPAKFVMLQPGDVQVQVEAALVVLRDVFAGLPRFVNVRERRRQHGTGQG